MDSIKQKLQSFKRFLEQDPDNVSLILEIAECQTLLGNKTQAQAMITRAGAIDKQAAQIAQGLFHLNCGALDEATEVFKQALMQDNSPAVRYNLAFCFYAKQKHNEAYDILMPVIEQQGERFPPALVLMARIEHQRTNIRHAIQLLEHHQACSANHADSLGLLSLLYFDCEEYEKAQKTSQQALALDSENIDALSVISYLEIKRHQADSKSLSTLIQRLPQDGRLYFALGSCLLRENKIQAAVDAFKTAAQFLPSFSENHLILGWSYLMLDDLNHAKQAFKHALSQQQDFAQAYGGLALVEILLKNLESGMALIKQAEKIDKHCHLATLAKALYFNHSDKEKAQFFYQKAIQDMAQDSDLPINTLWFEQLNPKCLH